MKSFYILAWTHNIWPNFCIIARKIAVGCIFDFCSLFRQAYVLVLSASNIKYGFKRCGIWQLNSRKLLNTPRLESSIWGTKISATEEIVKALEDSRKNLRDEILGYYAVFTQTFFTILHMGCDDIWSGSCSWITQEQCGQYENPRKKDEHRKLEIIKQQE